MDIGAGAKILGAIHIGDDVAIGANAVVLGDVPSNSIAVGVPARVLPRRPVMAKDAAYFGVAAWSWIGMDERKISVVVIGRNEGERLTSLFALASFLERSGGDLCGLCIH